MMSKNLRQKAQANLNEKWEEDAIRRTEQCLTERREALRVLKRIEQKIVAIQENYDADTSLEF